jgi:hypothetical protein
MEEKKIIVFQYKYGWGDHEAIREEVEFDIDATEEEINEAWRDWVWQTVGERCTWYEKK